MKYKEVKTPEHIANDCDLCCFVLNCINTCRLPKGYHYEEKK